MMFPGLHPAAMMSTVSMVPQAIPAAPRPGAHGAAVNGGRGQTHAGGSPAYHHHQRAGPSFEQLAAAAAGMPVRGGVNPAQLQQSETVFLYVPNSSVGAVIGTKGNHIRNVIKFSGASVKIAQPASDGADGQNDSEENDSSTTASGKLESADRRVTIVGPPESQWKAQYLIFEKLREEGFARGHIQSQHGGAAAVNGPALEEVRLTAEIFVPATQVGRIIGKGGANVRELQKVTGAGIKLPEQGSVSGEETPVHISGGFYAVQSAQRRLRAMVAAAGIPPSNPHHVNVAPSSSPPIVVNNVVEQSPSPSDVVRLEESSEC